MDNWQLFRDSRFSMQFKYPRRAKDGEPVEQLETQQQGILRVHILSPKSREVYFEVSKYDLLTAASEYQRHKEYLPRLFQQLVISELQETVCASLSASEYTFEWDQGNRAVMLVEREDATYRILYNPGFSVNSRILSTVDWLKLT